MPIFSTPTVFYLPFQRLTVGIEVNCCKSHSMGRATIEGRNAVGLIHTKRSAEESTIIEVIKIEVTTLTIKLFSYIIA